MYHLVSGSIVQDEAYSPGRIKPLRDGDHFFSRKAELFSIAAHDRERGHPS
jgi:hypothetical protein